MHNSRFVALAFVVGWLGACASAPREAAATLAASTSQLNERIQSLVATQQQINAARSRLSDAVERSGLRTENRTEAQLAVWRVFESGADHGLRLRIFEAARTHAVGAEKRYSEATALEARIVSMSARANAEGSAELAETRRHLIALATKRSLKESIQFVVGYAQDVDTKLDGLSKAVEAAQANVEAKAAAAVTSAAKPDEPRP